MKKLALLAVLAGTFAFGQTKKVTSSDIHWWGYKVAKTASSSHDGTIHLKSGAVEMKGNTVVGGTFVMDMNSITATDITGERQQKLNAHLKQGDFFEVEKYPIATYKITSVKKNKNKDFNYTVHGNLTVRNKTNPVAFPAKITVDNGVVTIISDKFSWDRQKFDVNYKSTMQDVIVKDDIDMTIKVSAK